jgi:hypothetical protein
LWLAAGGSIGHGGCWALDIDEGALDEHFGGRKWEVVKIESATEARQATTEEADLKKKEKKARGDKADDAKVLQGLDKLANEDGVAGYTKVRAEARLSNDRMTRAVNRLKAERVIENADFTIKSGKGHKVERSSEGLRRCKRETDGTDGTAAGLGGQS